MSDPMADCLTVPLLRHDGGMSPRRMGLAHHSIAPYGVFKTKDGTNVLISIQNDLEWKILAKQVLANTALAEDARFATNVARVARRDETGALITAHFATCNSADLIGRLAEADIAFAVVNDMQGLREHAELRRADVATPSGPVSYPAPPVRWQGVQQLFGPVPALGEHAGMVRREFLSVAGRGS
jgi:itaconate CoA-transferase